MNFKVCTTWHKTGYKKYGDHFIQGFCQNWPSQVDLTIYAEEHEPNTYDANNIKVLDQHTTLPDLKSWQEQHKDNDNAHGWNKDHSKKSFLWDASRFANKVFAIWHMVDNTDADIVIWCDGDVRTHSPITLEFLQSMAPAQDELVTYLGRRTWPECGWMMFNTRHPDFKEFMKEWRWIYESNDIFNHVEYHDSYIFGELIIKYKASGTKFNDIGGPDASGHVFINSPLGAYMDHLKGFRKELGRSNKSDLQGNWSHTAEWWNDMKQVSKQQIQQEKLKNPHEYDATQQQRSDGIKK